MLNDPRKAYFMAAQAVPWADMGEVGNRPEVLEARYVFNEAASQISAHVVHPAREQRILGASSGGDILAISREVDGSVAARSPLAMTLSVLRFDAAAGKLSRRGAVALVANRAEPMVQASFSPDGTTVLVTDVHVGAAPGRATKVSLTSDPIRAESWVPEDMPWSEGTGLPQSLSSLPPSAYGYGQVLHSAATADGREAAAAVFQGGGVRRFRLQAGGWAEAGLLPTPQLDPAETIHFSEDGRVLFGLSSLGAVFLWDLRQSAPELVTLRPSVEPVIGVAVPAGSGRVMAVGSTSVSSWPLDEVLDQARRDLAAERALYNLMPEPVANCPSRRELVSFGLLKASVRNAGDLDNVPPQEPKVGRHLCRLVRGMGDP